MRQIPAHSRRTCLALIAMVAYIMHNVADSLDESNSDMRELLTNRNRVKWSKNRRSFLIRRALARFHYGCALLQRRLT
jgi:hypothetical protein